jgi:hypothetical protein
LYRLALCLYPCYFCVSLPFSVFFSVVLRKGGGFVRRELWSREKAEEEGEGGGGAMEAVDSVVNPIKEFAKDSVRLVNRCHKPDRKGMLFAWIPSLRSFSDP